MTGNSTNRPQISIVVPVFNEICIIETFVAHLKSHWNQLLCRGGDQYGFDLNS